MSALMKVNIENTFIREIEKNDGDVLNIHQLSVGDVGCVVWDAALVVSKYLETVDFEYGDKIRDKHVLELGAGTGALGIMAASLGAHVTVTDLEEFVPLMELNIQTNNDKIRGSIKAQSLSWGQERIDAQFDFMLIADCIYYEKSLEPLVNAIETHCNQDTQVFCCYEERTDKQKLETKFFNLMAEKFNSEEISMERQDPHFRSDDIHIIKFCKKTL